MVPGSDFDELWQQYFLAASESKALFNRYKRGEISIDEWIAANRSDEIHDLCRACAKSYSNKLISFPEEQRVGLYLEDIKSAAGQDDLFMLEVLDAVPAHCEMVVQVAVDEFLLSYYVDFFKRTTDAYDTSKAQMLFERVLDTSEPDLDIYTRVIDEIFSMGKDPEWFAGFYHGIWKLLRRAPDNHETLLAVQKGLIGTGKDIKEDIEEIIAYAYENRRKILVHGIQLYEGSIIALMGFQTGAAPEIGMELSSGEVICRIDDFERPYEHGTLYNCLVTVLKGQLTEESRFEVQI